MRKQEEYHICWEALQSGCCVTTWILGVSPDSLKGFIYSLWRRCWRGSDIQQGCMSRGCLGNVPNTWVVIWWCFCAGFWQICLLLFEHCLSFHHMGCRDQTSLSRYSCNINVRNFRRQTLMLICAFEYLLPCSCVIISVTILCHLEQRVVWNKLAKASYTENKPKDI